MRLSPSCRAIATSVTDYRQIVYRKIPKKKFRIEVPFFSLWNAESVPWRNE